MPETVSYTHLDVYKRQTLYRVGYQKQTEHKKYIFVDGGMSDNIRPALYQAEYACDIANRMQEEKTETVTIAGKCCESAVSYTHLDVYKRQVLKHFPVRHRKAHLPQAVFLAVLILPSL